jgi:hypothetical protein
MFEELKSTFHRAAPTLAADLAGGLAIVVMFLVALHLPALV